jgi:hypothetical protein
VEIMSYVYAIYDEENHRFLKSISENKEISWYYIDDETDVLGTFLTCNSKIEANNLANSLLKIIPKLDLKIVTLKPLQDIKN